MPESASGGGNVWSGGAWSGGVPGPGGGVSGPGGVCLVQGGVVCLVQVGLPQCLVGYHPFPPDQAHQPPCEQNDKQV